MRVPIKGDEVITSRRRVRSSRGIMAAATAVTVVCILVVSCIPLVDGATDPNDVSALNTLFTDFNSDARLVNWVQSAGDPCGNNWLGVTCDGTFVTSIKVPGMGLNGKVQGWALQNLNHLAVLDLSQNNINSPLPDLFPSKLTDLNLSSNQFTGAFPYLLINIPTLNSIKLSNNKLDGALNAQVFSKLVNATTLDVSNNAFTGPIPDTVGDMANLQYLYLQNNKLSGQIPASFSKLLVLDTLDVSNNMLTGYLPPNLNPPHFRYGGNQLSQQAPPLPPYTPPPRAPPPPPKSPNPVTPPKASTTPSSSKSSSSSFFTGSKIVVLVVVVVLVLAAAGVAVWFFVIRHRPERFRGGSDVEANHHSSRRTWFLPLIPPGKAEKKRRTKVFEPDTLEKGTEEQSNIRASSPVKTLKVPPAFKREDVAPTKKGEGKIGIHPISATTFSVADLQEATNSFAQANLLGEGSLGCVYRAEFPNEARQVLAVKKLDADRASMVQHEGDFLGVVGGLARLQHANAVELVGYCVEHGQRLLVFEWIGQGTLHDRLHGSVGDTKGLSWNTRVKITLGAARALEYLHEVCSPPVVHRNFKSANILLDDDLNPHVSDCGLAALAPSTAESELSAQMLSSIGYSAPEYSMSGTFTAKSDVYSFGVVMLELLTGRKPFDSSRPRSRQSLVRWATPQLHDIDALARMVDPALEGVYPVKSLSRFADIVALCVQPEPEFRPPMSEVVQSLVRLMQRATLNKRLTDPDSGTSQTDLPDPYDC